VKRLFLAASALVAVGGLGACTSQPSAKAVAKDIAQSLTVDGKPLPQAQQDCMLKIIDAMSSDELDKLGKANEGKTITTAGGGTPEMNAFIAKLQTCEPDKG
jgi:hypothetical protein